MGLFTADLYRNFAIGFAAGAAIVGAQVLPHQYGSFGAAIAAILPF